MDVQKEGKLPVRFGRSGQEDTGVDRRVGGDHDVFGPDDASGRVVGGWDFLNGGFEENYAAIFVNFEEAEPVGDLGAFGVGCGSH